MKCLLKYQNRYREISVPSSYPDVVLDMDYMIGMFKDADNKDEAEASINFSGLGPEVRFTFFGEYRKDVKVFECRI